MYMPVFKPKGVHAYTRTFMQGKACTCWKAKILSMVFDPWYFGIDPWYLVRSVDPRYSVQGIGSKWFWSMVLSKA